MHAAPVTMASAGSAPVASRVAAAPALAGWTPAPQSTTRRGWAALTGAVRASLADKAEARLGEAWPDLPPALYRAFSETGERAGYEAPYFARRLMLNDLVLGEAAERAGRFVGAIAEGIDRVLDEPGWQLPAHNAHVRDGARLPLPDRTRPVVDLFAAETGAQLALVAALMGPELDVARPGLCGRIDAEIGARLIAPYLEAPPWWTGAEGGQMNNWTAWCTRNMLRAAFLRPALAAHRPAVLAQAATSLDAFMAEYGEDGACPEGAYYWRHAALALHGALEVIDAATGGALAPVWRLPKLRGMAEFILHMQVAGDWYINFADASARLDPLGAGAFRFGRAVGSRRLMASAAADFSQQRESADPVAGLDLTARVEALFAAGEIAAFDEPPAPAGDVWLASTQMLVARDARFVLAAKAGHNDDPHNHNDVGSITLYADGQPLLIDLGVETYTAKTFSPERYEIWTMQSVWHNLADFGGIGQAAGREFAARDVEASLGAGEARLTCELAGAYPPEAGVESYRRAVRFAKGRGIEIEDICKARRPATLSLIFAAPPALRQGGVDVAGFGIAIEGAGEMRLETVPVADPRLRLAWPEKVFRLRVPFAGERLIIRIGEGGGR